MKKFFVVLFCLLLIAGCSNKHEEAKPIQKHSERDISLEKKKKPTITTNVKLVAIGDILIHDTVYEDAKINSGYDFKPMFAAIKPSIEQADLAIANQESMIGGSEVGVSSYPSFNSPYEVGDALKDMGIDFVTLANNHTLDRGERVVQSAIKHWNELGMPYTGSYISKEDAQEIRTLTKNNITFSFLAYTYGTNGIKAKQPYLVNYIDLEKIKTDVAKAKELSEVTVVSLHFGNEYERMPNNQQKQLVQELANIGVDIIIGHHPHVLQPVEWVEGTNGHKTFVAYSLGNFISGQKGDYKDIGGIVGIEVEKIDADSEVTISLKNPTFIPTFSGRNAERHYRVNYLNDVDSQKNKEIQNHLKQWVPELQFPQ